MDIAKGIVEAIEEEEEVIVSMMIIEDSLKG